MAGTPLRLATWNCPSGLTANWGILDELDVDVVTVQEYNGQTEDQALEHGWSCRWLSGPGPSKGVAVLARQPYTITKDEAPEPFFISATVEGGREPFTFVGFWAMDPGYARGSYVRQGAWLVDHLRTLEVPIVVAGDSTRATAQVICGMWKRCGSSGS